MKVTKDNINQTCIIRSKKFHNVPAKLIKYEKDKNHLFKFNYRSYHNSFDFDGGTGCYISEEDIVYICNDKDNIVLEWESLKYNFESCILGVTCQTIEEHMCFFKTLYNEDYFWAIKDGCDEMFKNDWIKKWYRYRSNTTIVRHQIPPYPVVWDKKKVKQHCVGMPIVDYSDICFKRGRQYEVR